MMNIVWAVLMILGVGYGLLNGQDATALGNTLSKSGEQAIALTMGLVGIVAFWSGLNRIAEKAGLASALGRLVRPLFQVIFPSLKGHDAALSAIVMNVCATLFGLGNAATPLGLEAMRQMQTKNPHPDTATDAMCTLLALNTTGLTIFPATVIGLRIAAKSLNPTAIVLSTLLASIIATITGLVVDGVLRRRWRQ
ncbi:MAG: nucleoside recognition domain-containing protein [Bacillota bacterium]|nr:nucleoside recognition domain-containing protein [Bacillota bacterium]